MTLHRPLALVRIVDDDEGVRDSYRFLIESDGWLVKTYCDAQDFLEHDAPDVPGVIVLDVRMPGLTGLELQQYLKTLANDLPIIFMSAHANVEMVVSAVQNGAIDFLPKPVDDEKLLIAIEKAVNISLTNQVSRQEKAQLRAAWERLSEREKETVHWIKQGLPNKLIAREMGISERTVQVHRANVFQKLGVKSAVEMMGKLQGFTP